MLLGSEPYNTAYAEPSRRSTDGRYGENLNRLQLFHPYLESLITYSIASVTADSIELLTMSNSSDLVHETAAKIIENEKTYQDTHPELRPLQGLVNHMDLKNSLFKSIMMDKESEC